MSLITRCPACSTAFKVVPDQLKISQGWVRCGHCAEVFDASHHLMPQETVWLPSALPAVDDMSHGQTTLRPESNPDTHAINSAFQQGDTETAIDAFSTDPALLKIPLVETDIRHESAADFDPVQWRQPEPEHRQNEFPALMADALSTDAPPVLIQEAVADDQSNESDQSAEKDQSPSAGLNDNQSVLKHKTSTDETVRPDANADADADADVSFIREAQRKAYRSGPKMRWSIALLSLVLAIGLMLQWALKQRDLLAAMEPRTQPALRLLCKYFHCQIRTARQIESIIIDGSTFSRIGPDAYSLKFALKNTQNTPLQIPHLEFTLTDTQDRAVVRRVLTPEQFGAKDAILAGQAELAGLVTLKVSPDNTGASMAASAALAASAPLASPGSPVLPSLPVLAASSVTGYRILVFYPD